MSVGSGSIKRAAKANTESTKEAAGKKPAAAKKPTARKAADSKAADVLQTKEGSTDVQICHLTEELPVYLL